MPQKTSHTEARNVHTSCHLSRRDRAAGLSPFRLETEASPVHDSTLTTRTQPLSGTPFASTPTSSAVRRSLAHGAKSVSNLATTAMYVQVRKCKRGCGGEDVGANEAEKERTIGGNCTWLKMGAVERNRRK
eukprot:5955456-Pleurochrysis_carterae.AAC.18